MRTNTYPIQKPPHCHGKRRKYGKNPGGHSLGFPLRIPNSFFSFPCAIRKWARRSQFPGPGVQSILSCREHKAHYLSGRILRIRMRNASLSVLQHVQEEPSGVISEYARRAGISSEVVPLYETNEVPPVSSTHLLILGGPMSVNDGAAYPFIEQEKRLIRSWIAKGRPLFGICLGAQMIAAACGGGDNGLQEGDRLVPVGSVRYGNTSRHSPPIHGIPVSRRDIFTSSRREPCLPGGAGPASGPGDRKRARAAVPPGIDSGYDPAVDI